jgi:hypothetical protein
MSRRKRGGESRIVGKSKIGAKPNDGIGHDGNTSTTALMDDQGWSF